jgi:3-hydroxy-9,10-secoandrosta-1,3,5(10)-triene-9,17-dione monooxygenase reductase component
MRRAEKKGKGSSMSQITPARTKIDTIDFRNALGAFVTGVTIVTTLDDAGKPVGLTANSFNSVSLEPPMVLWSLGLNSGSIHAFRTAKHWAVHILASDQEALSGRFAKRGIDKFECLETETGPDGIPLLKGCTARFVCKASFEYEGGDHAIFVGEVVDFERQSALPLAFHQGRYTRVISAEAPATEGVPFGLQFLGHSLSRLHFELFNEIRVEYRKRGLRGRQYTVLTVLGIGDNCGADEIIRRAGLGGVRIDAESIVKLAETGLLINEDNRYRLSNKGRQFVIELIAVAQASQERLESRLAPGELSTLRHLVSRAIEVCSTP